MSRAAAISRKISLVPRGRRSGADWEAHVEAWRAAVAEGEPLAEILCQTDARMGRLANASQAKRSVQRAPTYPTEPCGAQR